MSTDERATAPSAAPQRLLTGLVLADRYEIQACIGEGGMGEVYRGRDLQGDRNVAIKVLKTDLGARDPDMLERFVREGEALRKLRHGNIVQLLDALECDGRQYLIMELVEGGSLRSRLQRMGPLPVRQAVELSLELADALARVHHMGILHRDIKPDNVLLAPDGTPRLTDFGVARIVATTQLTRAGSIVGTVDYLSPDALNGDPLDAGTDLWAFGVMLFELLAGSRPFAGATAGATVGAILGQPLPDLSELRPGLPPQLVSLVGHLLVKQREQRLRSARQLAAELETILRELPAQRAPSPGPSIKGKSSLPIATTAVSSTGGTAGEFVHAPTVPSTAVVEKTRRHPSGAGAPGKAAPDRTRRIALFVLPMMLLAAGLLSAAALRVAGSRTQPQPPDAALPDSTSSALETQPGRAAVTDLPMPASNSPEALVAYRRGMQLWRAGNIPLTEFEKAVALDPSLAAAHLRIAAMGAIDFVPLSAREHFQKANEYADALAPRDRAVLEGIEPILMRQPVDWMEATRRFGKAVERFPHDAELWFYYGIFQASMGDMEAALPTFERALAEDPGFIFPLALKVHTLTHVGRFREAREAADACDRIGRGALACAAKRFMLAAHEGECGEVESVARHTIAANESLDWGYRLLALSLAAQRKPAATVRQAWAQALDGIPAPDRPKIEMQQHMTIAAWSGDFEAAEKDARSLMKAAETARRQDEHANPTHWLVGVLTETGRTAAAGRVAMEFLDRMDAWEPDPMTDNFGIEADWTPSFIAAAERAGRIRREEFLARRDAWITAREKKTLPAFRNYLWIQGYAALADTPEHARDALDALPRYSPIPPFHPLALSWWGIGSAYLLAGQIDDALPWLEQATKSCYGLEFPFEYTHAHLWLGRALERANDKPRACAAYGAVLERWGKAKPRSVTAEEARARIRALGCPSK